MYIAPDGHGGGTDASQPRKGLGRKPNPPDERDKLYPMRALIPTEVTPRTRRFWAGEDLLTPGTQPLILDQGMTGTCVANDATHWLNDAPVTQPNLVLNEDYAVQLYVEGTGDTSLQDGAYTRQIVDVLKKRGLMPTYNWAESVDDIVDHLLYRGPVMFACNWTAGCDNPQTIVWPNGKVRYYLTYSGSARGGHSFLLDGVLLTPPVGPPFVRMRNSWGKGWCNGGFAQIAIEELTKMFLDWGDAVVAGEVQAA
jgi:hypothetical protein